MTERSKGSLAGLRVIETGTHPAGPLLGLLLADQGADVVRIARPGTPDHPVWRRGKALLPLDLDAPDDHAIARALAERADVWIDGNRPRAMARRGLDAATLRALNPGLITVSLPGFAADDPRANLPAWEGAVSALSGLYERPWRGRPGFTALPLASFVAALYAAVGVAAALLTRERDDQGQHVEVPIYDATFSLHALTAARGVRPPRAWTVARWDATPFSGAWRCADGAWLFVDARDASALAALCAGLRAWDRGSVADAIDAATSAATRADPSSPSRVREAERVRRILARAFRAAPAAAWAERLGEAGVAAAEVSSPEAWLSGEHARAAGLVVRVADAALGALTEPSPAVHLRGATPRVAPPPPHPTPCRPTTCARSSRHARTTH